MREYELVGFIADLNGREDTFFTADPVVRTEGRVYTAEAEAWTHSDLRPLEPSGYDYVDMLPESQRRLISPGDVLWLVGDELADDIDAIHQPPRSDIERFKRAMSRWEKTVRRGYPWTVGPRAEFRRTARRPLAEITRLLHAALFDRFEQQLGDADRYFAVFEGLTQEDTSESLMTTALYYRERRDELRLRSVARQAVRAGIAETVDHYLDAVEAQAKRLSATRLSELEAVSAPSHHPDAAPIDVQLGQQLYLLSFRSSGQTHRNAGRFAALLESLLEGQRPAEQKRMREKL